MDSPDATAKPLAIVNIVGLSPSVLGEQTPNLNEFRFDRESRTLIPHLPAVTTTSPSTMLTGTSPAEHGIVANGWYNRELCEVMFWKQSNRLVQGEKLWETMRRRDPDATCLNMFWWYNMYSSVDYSVTPRPQYKADGRKIPDCYSWPPDLRNHLQSKFGRFPLFKFWGPMSSIESSTWIIDATIETHRRTDPTLTLGYLPHLDYAYQHAGPDSDEARRARVDLDGHFGRLLGYFHDRGVEVMVVSEYVPVSKPVHINRALREHGYIEVREEGGTELLDPGASRAFAVADHQTAHVYIENPEDVEPVARLLESVDGIDLVLDSRSMSELGIAHERSGELLAVADHDAWFTYYHWLDDARAPDFARTVNIHRKPGYDPVELFIDPEIAFPQLKVLGKLVKKRLGFRTLMDVIPLDATLVKGSHGRSDAPEELRPMLIGTDLPPANEGIMPMEAVRDAAMDRLFRG